MTIQVDLAPTAAQSTGASNDESVAGLGGESPYSGSLHAAFNALNRWLAIPALRTGTGLLFMSPLVGYTCLLRTRGRNSGLVREAPLLYTIRDGAVYVVAGFGEKADRRILQEKSLFGCERCK